MELNFNFKNNNKYRLSKTREKLLQLKLKNQLELKVYQSCIVIKENKGEKIFDIFLSAQCLFSNHTLFQIKYYLYSNLFSMVKIHILQLLNHPWILIYIIEKGEDIKNFLEGSITHLGGDIVTTQTVRYLNLKLIVLFIDQNVVGYYD